MKNKKYLFILICFLMSSIMTMPSLIPSYYLDGYCSLCSGFSEYALNFFKAGRYLTALFYIIFDFIKINPDIVSVFSVILSNLFLSIAVYLIYKEVMKYLKRDKIVKLLIMIGAFLICFNPFVIEIFIFEESFAICLAILFVIMASNIAIGNSKNRYLKSILLLFLATCLYQGVLCLFVPYAFLLHVLKVKESSLKRYFVNHYKEILKILLCYASTLIFAFLLLKINLKIFDLYSAKFGELNILKNIKSIFYLSKYASHSMFELVESKLYYLFIFLMFTIVFVMNFKNTKKHLTNYSYIFIVVILSIIFAFIPNLAMNSLDNYTAARMTISIGAIIGMIIILLSSFFEKNSKKTYKHLLVFLSIIFFGYIIFLHYKNSYYELKRYELDKEYALNIKEQIQKYEEESLTEIKYIYFYKDASVGNLYKGLNSNNNTKFYSVDWGFGCGMNYFLDSEYKIETRNFDDKNFSEKMNGVRYRFEDNKVYLILYDNY